MNTIHPTKSVRTVQPRYVAMFSCTGPACEDNCCTGWNVHIDKKTFNTYRQAKNPELTERLSTQVKRVRSLKNDAQYARIEMDPVTKACPFMEQKLCSIQREMGEDKLSDTCATYPRNSRLIAGQHELSLTLSCPEAARLALLKADAMDFVEDAVRLRPNVISAGRTLHGLTMEMMSSIRIFALQLMRASDLVLWQKLALLGVFCEQLTQTLKTSGHSRVPAMLENINDMVSNGLIVDALSEMQPDYASQARVFSRLWQLKINGKLSPQQEMIQKSVALGLGADPLTNEVSEEQLIKKYISGISNLKIAMANAPFLLDNYVINEMFNEVFPFGAVTPDLHFQRLVTRLGLIRLMLAAQCNDLEKLPLPEQMAKTVQVFCRLYQHDTNFATNVNNALRLTGWNNLEKIFKFIRV
uniref:flagellin lysine-N-methylase n=1 Tax=Limnohabitans sp. TaxID=1907725 RepID=UPI0040482974